MTRYNTLNKLQGSSLSDLGNSKELIGNIEEPSLNQQVNGNTLTVSGWSINPSGVKEVKVYIDGVLKGKATIGLNRPDVASIYKQSYSNTSTSGYKLDVDISQLSAGTKTVTVEQVGNDATVLKQTKTIVVKRLQAVARIDEPNEGENISANSIKVRGWAISSTGVKEVKVYVDGKLKGTVTPNKSRLDIKNAFSKYPGAETSGYELMVDLSDIAGGSKVIKTEEISNDNSINVSERKINIKKLSSLGRIDEPSEGNDVTSTSVKVRGWAIAPSGIKKVNIYVDGVLKGTVVPSTSRPDIKNAFSNYPNAGTSGYEVMVDLSGIAVGSKVIRAEEIANDNSVNISERKINVKKVSALGRIDEPSEGKEVTATSVKVRGWAIAPSGIKKVNIYVNEVLKGTVVPSNSRPDIKNAFSNYPNAGTSGYEVMVDLSDVAGGNKVIRTEEIANDNSVNVSNRTINIKKVNTTVGRIDEPNESGIVKGKSMKVRGWALSPTGVKQIKIYVDGVLKNTLTPNVIRPDIKNAFPNYPNADKSGYEALVDISNVAPGKRVIKVEEVSNDNTISTQVRNIQVQNLDSLGTVEGYSINGNTMKVSGWAISGAGVKEVKVYVNGILKGTVVPSFARADVSSAYANYMNIAKSGYELSVDITNIPRGTAVITTQEISKDGTVGKSQKNITVNRNAPIGSIDEPSDGTVITSNEVQISGWGTNDSKTTAVNIYIDGVFKSSATIGISRLDVKNAYKNYQATETSGYQSKVNVSSLAAGKHTIKVEVIAVDGSKNSMEREFYNKSKTKLIVVDPGHNYGGDYGAVSIINGVKYDETVMNMAVALRLESTLKAQGYAVVLTRSALDRSTIDLSTSLKNRAVIANSLNADLFISIHHNASPSSSARGSEVYYTQRTTPDDASVVQNADKISKGRDLAIATASSMSANTGFINKGGKGDVSSLGYSLSVLRNTKMPAILVECGFLTNPTEASLLNNASIQQAEVNGITSAVKARY
nr:N-acetylmuramoyl-L-alanine amidase [Clostridium vincentii]